MESYNEDSISYKAILNYSNMVEINHVSLNEQAETLSVNCDCNEGEVIDIDANDIDVHINI